MALNGDEGDGVVTITEETAAQCTSQRSLLYDKAGEEYYNIISALYKSARNSDPDSAAYWLARMLESGEDPIHLVRCITCFAAENIGLADMNASAMVISAFHVCHFIRMPECTVHLVEIVVYLSVTPESSSSYIAYEHAEKDVLRSVAEPMPLVTRNAPIRLMKGLGYGEGYRSAHNEEDKAAANTQCLPNPLVDTKYYAPVREGYENRLKEHLTWLRTLRQGHQ